MGLHSEAGTHRRGSTMCLTPAANPLRSSKGRMSKLIGTRGSLRLRLTGMGEHPSSRSTSALRVLGVDPAATGPTGYAIIEREGRECRVLHYGAFKVTARRQKSSVGAALEDVHALLCGLIKKFRPQVMAVESIFTALNMRTALRLAEVRGVVLLAGEQLGVEVCSYSPREVKACIAGYGHADKKQM